MIASLEIRKFRQSVIISIIAVYLLILAGGIVRSTGSGMGCPDWPRCFGRIIPPVHESQLPADYKERYKVAGHEAVFNVTKTWIEYVNRLLGALTGLLVIWVVICGWRIRKKDYRSFILSAVVLGLVIIEGLVGKYVVATHLKPVAITIHMYGSIIIILLLIYLLMRTYSEDLTQVTWIESSKLKKILTICILLTFVQVFTGTQVRQEIDQFTLMFDYQFRDTWIEKLSNLFQIHRTFSWVVIGIHFVLLSYLRKNFETSRMSKRIATGLISVLLLEVLAGVLLNYAGFPAFIQPLHLLLAIVLLSIQFFLLYVLTIKPVASSRLI